MILGNAVEFLGYANSLPPSDLDTLRALSPQDLRTWAVAQAEIHRNHALALLSIHNVIAPIHRLPNEMLSEIFSWAGQPPRGIYVAHVCRRWRAILWKTPAFWENILEGERFDLQETLHARELGNRLTYLTTALDNSTPRKSLNICTFHFPPALRSLLDQHSSRIGALDVSIYGTSQKVSLFEALAPGIPHLKELTIKFCWEPDSTVEAWCFAENLLNRIKPLSSAAFPCLVSIDCPALLTPLLSMDHLNHVKIRGSMSPNWPFSGLLSAARMPSPEAFLKFLDCVKNVQTLHLLDGALPDDIFVWQEPRATYFSSLTSLRISDKRGLVSAAMQYFRLPPRVAVHLSDPEVTGEETPFLSRHGLRLGLWKEVISDIDRVEASTSTQYIDHYRRRRWFTIRGYCNGERRLRFDYSKESIAQKVAFEPFIGNSRITHLLHTANRPFHPEHYCFPRTQANPFLRALPYLRSLNVINQDFSGLLGALQCAGHEGFPVVCPVLEDLVIECCFDSEELAQSVRSADFHSDVVVGRFRERLKELVVALQARAAHGSRLKSLRWSELEEKALRNDRKRLATEIFVVKNWGLDEGDPDLQTLRSLVDGKVKIGKVRLFAGK